MSSKEIFVTYFFVANIAKILARCCILLFWLSRLYRKTYAFYAIKYKCRKLGRQNVRSFKTLENLLFFKWNKSKNLRHTTLTGDVTIPGTAVELRDRSASLLWLFCCFCDCCCVCSWPSGDNKLNELRKLFKILCCNNRWCCSVARLSHSCPHISHASLLADECFNGDLKRIWFL